MLVDIQNYEGLYQVSEEGQVYSLRKNCYLKPQLINSGYLIVQLHKAGHRETKLVHRLVAEAFIENDNPQEKNQINHLDENKLNNNVTNLEWCTPTQNINYGTAMIRQAEKISKPVDQFTLDNEFIKTWPSAKVAEEYYHVAHGSITHCCANRTKTICNYLWKYHK